MQRPDNSPAKGQGVSASVFTQLMHSGTIDVSDGFGRSALFENMQARRTNHGKVGRL